MGMTSVVEGIAETNSGLLKGCKSGQSDAGKGVVGTLMDAATVAVATYNSLAMIEMADKQYDIAKRYLEIAKWWRNYYNSTFKPWEDKELEEAWELEEEPPLYDMAIGRARTFGRIQFKGLAERSIRCTSEYCTGLRGALLKDVINSEATTVASLSSLGYRNERAYVEARSDVRWQRRLEVLNRGREMIANNIQYAKLAYGIFGDLGKQAALSAAGAVKYLGYSWNKNETQFPMLYRGAPRVERPTQPVQSTPQPTIRSGVVFDNDSGVGRVATPEDYRR